MALFGNFLENLVEFARNIGGSKTIRGGPGLPTIIETTPFGMPRPQEFLKPVVGQPTVNPYDIPRGGVNPSVEAVNTPSPRVSDLIPDFVTQDRPNLPQRYVNPVISASQAYPAVSPAVLASLLAQETGGTGYAPSEAFGPSGEVGISQITPELFYQGSSYPDIASYTLALQSDPDFAIREAARIINDLLNRYGGDIFSALAAYNAGPTGFSELGRGTNYAGEVLRRIGQ